MTQTLCVFSLFTSNSPFLITNSSHSPSPCPQTGDSLIETNKALSTLPFHSDYPDYHAHMTIAYLKKGAGKKYCEKMDGHEHNLVPTYAIFSQPDGTKTKIKINYTW